MANFEHSPEPMKLAKSEGTPITAEQAREILFALMQAKMTDAPNELTMRASHTSERKGYLNQHDLSTNTSYREGTLISFTFLIESWEKEEELKEAAEYIHEEQNALELAAREADLARREAELATAENTIKTEREAIANLKKSMKK